MKRGVKISLIGATVIVLAALIVLGWLFTKAAPIGTGYVAKYLCSSTFISGRDPAIVFKEDVSPVNPLARVVEYRIDRRQKSVTADSFGLFGLTAIYREGCGCSLVIGTTAGKMAEQKLVEPGFMKNRPHHDPTMPWPAGSRGPVDPSSMGIDTVGIGKALDVAFAEPGPQKRRKTRAILIVYNGKLVAERYAPGFNKDMSLLGWSMSKTVTNALVGILVHQQKLDPMQPAPVPEWQNAGDPRRKITMDQLLRMSSGLSFEEVYAPLYDATYMLYGSYDFAAYAAAKPLEAEPDSKWYYSSGTANIVARIVRQAVEKDYPYYYDFIYDELFDKIGMYSAVLEPDSSGTFAASGFQEQRVIVIPSKKLVLIRFGATTERKAWDTDAFIKSVLASLPS